MTIPDILDPSLDAATIRALKAVGIDYLGTHWSGYFQEWQHHVMVSTPASRHMVKKTNAGIAALLRKASTL